MKQHHKLIYLFILAALIAAAIVPAQTSPAQASSSPVAAITYPDSETLTSAGTPVIDGVIDAAYGSPLASDPSGDGNGNTNMDLLDLYVTDDASYYYFAFTVNDNISNTNWGKYVLYVDTTNDTNGATSDAWGRSVTVNDPHKPEFGIYSWVDSPPYDPSHTQLVSWDQVGGSWDWGNAGQVADGAIGAGSPSVIEWQVAKSDLGNPSTIWIEVWNTGGGGSDNAQDTINDPADDWNATDWVTQAVLLNSTEYPSPGASPPSGGTCTSGAAQDGNVWWSDLGHDSRDELYRTPGGPVITGTLVTLRFRATCDDLTQAQVRVWDDRNDTETIYDMDLALQSGQYEWWEVTLPASSDPSVYWYRFLAIDGSSTAYYEDDSLRDGGWGQTFSTSMDYSWQLTIYDPNFQTPDWIKNAVVYQIFTDRFRDSDPANNTPAGSFFYEEDTSIERSSDPNGYWNAAICDPRDSGSVCPNVWSQNFYGGDLQGIVDKLDYLQGLGITAIYLNPIFESPSNHKYDTTDFSIIDDNFGDLALFQTLVTEAGNRGISVILDGVFNHTSSDSIYFDRYSRYSEVGACEDPASPYRAWYFFTDVTPGTGECAGSDGTPNAATYTSWFGFDSLPKLDSSNTEVRDLIWSGGTSAIARFWVDPAQGASGWRLDVAGDVDPGTISDPTNDYWEGFRDAVHQSNPNAYIVGEEWGNATSWVIGDEWDATMNYQYSTLMLGFWRDTAFTDNDHNSASSAGIINPLTPSQLNEGLLNWIERYPPEALYAMMNLLGSHDPSRPLFMLDHDAAVGTDDTLLDDPNYDWSDSIARLKGVILLQMTLPGAPTVYYGDEVGNIGPVTYDNGKWEDDPYNRIPYPWLDETGAPFYTFLQSQTNQDVLYNYYAALATARNAHDALRIGSFDPLLVDDTNVVYAYGRKTSDNADAAVVILNRAGTITNPVTQTVTLSVTGYLPYGAVFTDVLSGDAYVVDGSGILTVTVPGQSGAVLVLAAPIAAPPAAVTDLAVTGERSEELDLNWTAVISATSYDIYRSQFSGGGYTFITNTTSISYTDTGLQNASSYYYVVVGWDDANGLDAGYSNEASGIPHYDLSTAWYNLQWPATLTHTISTITSTENIYGQLWISGTTGGSSPATGISAQVGYALSGTLPISGTGWTWVDMTYNAAAGNNDEYYGSLLPDALGTYQYATRWSSDSGQTWYYADLGGTGYDPAQAGVMYVIASGDLTPPAAPQNLVLDGTTSSSITFSWDPNGEPDLAGYEIYRQTISSTLNASLSFARIASVVSTTTSYVDTGVVTDQSYQYYIEAFDTSFNRSASSNVITATAEARFVNLILNVTVPDYTPGTVYIAGDITGLPFWDPSATPMSATITNTWTISLTLLDGDDLEYKFTRGDWNRVEKQADGNTEISNRQLTVDYGSNGIQIVDHTVANWRDPIVVAHYPADGATDLSLTPVITVTWNQSMTVNTGFTVTGPDGVVSGTFGYDAASFTVTFTPTGVLTDATTYTVTVSGETDAGGDSQQVPVTFDFSTTGADLAISKVDSADPATIGSVLTYTVTITNHGPSTATNVTVTDTLPTGLGYVSDDGGCVENAGVVVCDLGGIANGGSVIVQIAVSADQIGVFTNTVSVSSDIDDPDTSDNSASATTTVEENDGVDDTVEDGAPNNGDGNGDGIPDSEQANVTSLPNPSGDYVTLEAPAGITLGNVAITATAPVTAPDTHAFSEGFFDFSVNNVGVGGTVVVTITLHSTSTVDGYWKYGPTPDDSTSHWYDFSYDGTTGAVIKTSGVTTTTTTITLYFVDGQRGDADLIANGSIADPGAPALQVKWVLWLPIVQR